MEANEALSAEYTPTVRETYHATHRSGFVVLVRTTNRGHTAYLCGRDRVPLRDTMGQRVELCSTEAEPGNEHARQRVITVGCRIARDIIKRGRKARAQWRAQ